MAHWQDQFVQSQPNGLFLPRIPPIPQKQMSSPGVCSLCHQPREREGQSNDHRPSLDDAEGWKQYWENKSQPWRTEPEISCCRQHELSQRRLIQPEPEKGIYPFGEMSLNRADVEWLLATHENGRGPINWNDESQRDREGLDLRGAQLEAENLQELPLAQLRGGFYWRPHVKEGITHLTRANLCGAQLEGASLCGAQLEGADLVGAQLEGVDLREAQLEEAHLIFAQLKGANLSEAQLEGADLSWTQLEGANLSSAKLKRANLMGAQLEGADLSRAQLEGANLRGAQLEGAHLIEAQLKGANLIFAQLKGAKLIASQLEGADLSGAQLEGADLSWAQLERADLIDAQLKGASFSLAQLEGVDLRGAQLEDVQLAGTTLTNDKGIGPSVADVSWAGTNMSVITWSDIVMLGDENRAHQMNDDYGKKKNRATRLGKYRNAMRATHQLAVVLQDQGLTPDASRFAYRAKRWERAVRWYELRTITWQDQNSQKRTVKSMRKGLIHSFSILLSWFFSWFLFLIAGYGYRLRFCFFWYVLVVSGCAFAYLRVEPHYFTWWTALGESVNVFHGRGASPNIPQLTHPARFAMLTIAEAWAGLVIEVVFVATLIQRFFGK